MSKKLELLFQPRSIVLIGGSRNQGSMGGTLVRNLVDSFRGPLYFVHPTAESLGGRPVARSLDALPLAIDLAIVAVPARAVLNTIEDCLRRQVRGIVLITAGFAETGDEGRAAEQILRAKADAAGVPLVGPNCLGILNLIGESPFNATFSLASPRPGDVAVCTQSGALGFVFPDYMQRYDLGIAQLLSLGNKLMVSENDVLELWEDDDRLRVVQLYLESLQDPRRFVEIGRRLSRRRPLVMLYGGRTQSGSRAAGSHTAALATPVALMRAAARQAGAVLADSLEEFFDVAAQLALQPPPHGVRTAVLTNAGGPGVLCVDALAARGFDVPKLSAATRQSLRKRLPPHASVGNPVDLVGSTSPDEFADCLRMLLESTEIDNIVVLYVPRTADTSAAVAQAIGSAATAAPHDKTLAAVFLESGGPPLELRVGKAAIPCFPFPENAARALHGARRYARWLKDYESMPTDSTREVDRAQRDASPWLHEPLFEHDGWQNATTIDGWIASVGLSGPDWGSARTVDEALDLWEKLGGRVTMKTLAPSLLHKSRAGGVENDLRSSDEVRAAFRRLSLAATDVEGVLVQQFRPGEREVFVGVRRDPRFGLVLACGAGGTRVEQQRDVAFGMAPLSCAERIALAEEAGLLEEAPDAAAQGAAIIDLLERIERLALATPGLAEADFNPIAISSPGPPLLLDVRLRIDRSSPRE
ncbi:MAG: acetate--CoA ligase family protein [Pirellulales bacterium]